VTALQTNLKQADHTVVLELFTNRTHQYRTHVDLRWDRERYAIV
jgi:23S rRNA-/tRNA-specific pseudouridylate synthase